MGVLWEPELDPAGATWLATARTLAAEKFAPLAAELDRDQRYPWEHVAAFVESGLTGVFVPTEYGGAGLSMQAVCAITEEVSRACAATGAILAAYELGAVPLLLAGTDEQRRLVLGDLLRGRAVSFALSENGAGSDAAAITTTALPDGDGFRLRGEKIYIGNGGAAQHYVVFAKTDPDAGARGITAFLIDKDTPGAVIDRYEDKMGIRGTRTSNLKLDARVPADAILGERGRGLRLALRTLDLGRISVAAQGLGIAAAAYQLATAEAARRSRFGRTLLEHQGIGFRLADLATGLTAARLLTYQAARAYDDGASVSTIGAMAKLYTSEVAHRAVDLAVQVYGGEGYCKPCPAERLYRDQRVLEIYEGTSEIQRIVIARAIGADQPEPVR
ncbi:acyl-CoA dehydrogenase family protein [Micromonospora sp. LOL_021]|uniref:acyl-CoA dehydrogenase family protein n=1 Tax=Micromonospora sp. LOL_021 TaxID=3345417 RepID=UPI003A861595